MTRFLFYLFVFSVFTLLAKFQVAKTMKKQKLKVTMMKKLKLPRFSSFRFCPIPEIENWEISESFLLIQFLVVSYYTNIKRSINQRELGSFNVIYLALTNIACKFS